MAEEREEWCMQQREVYCNACGKKLAMQNGILLEDAFEAWKQWGYFSRKDAVLHSFVLCEDCYDKMIKSFVLPVKEEEVTEL